MNIPFKLKSFIFSTIDFFDAHRILYFLQKHVTKRSRVEILSALPIWQTHKKYLQKYGTTKTLFEFGAGKTLAQNLYLSDIVEKQIVVDLNPMIDLALVNNVRYQISKLVDLKSDIKIDKLYKLGAYGIEYRAPYDAAQTDFNEKTIDACVSTNTLEHIPEESILSIFLRLYKTLKDDGIVSAKIDYSDHYAHTDKTISLLNYLKFDQNEWKKYNHNCHFQNRLRHYDYVKIFKRCGFVVIEEDLVFSESEIPTEIIQAFKDKDETWKATSAHIVLKKTS
jgi:hypothetical protein